jgi:hypothetical protein
VSGSLTLPSKWGFDNTIDFKIFVQQKFVPFYEAHVQWMNLMKNQIIQKLQSLEILKERVGKQRTHFFNHLAKTLCSMFVQSV